jgi:hypothetical protein
VDVAVVEAGVGAAAAEVAERELVAVHEVVARDRVAAVIVEAGVAIVEVLARRRCRAHREGRRR